MKPLRIIGIMRIIRVMRIILIITMISSALNLYLPRISMAEEDRFPAERREITKHTPEFLSTPEEEFPPKKVIKPAWKSLLCWGGVAGAVALIVAIAGGGGGGGGGGDDGDKGTVNVGW